MNSIYLLADSGVRDYRIATILGIPEQEVCEAIEDRNNYIRQVEKDYRQNEWPKVQEQLRYMISDVPLEERNQMRLEYLSEELPKAKQEFLDACMEFAKLEHKVFIQEHVKELDRLKKRLTKLGFDFKIYTGKAQGLSPELVARAAQQPMKDLVENRNGMAKCPFHNDKTPSMDVRKNFYYCYGCGATGDAIDFLRKTKGLTFRQAVEALN